LRAAWPKEENRVYRTGSLQRYGSEKNNIRRSEAGDIRGVGHAVGVGDALNDARHTPTEQRDEQKSKGPIQRYATRA
jgi:hypothetical protein